MAYIGQGIKQGTFKVLDTSGNTYNGSNTTFSLGTQVGSAAQLLVSHDGVIQLPGTDYTLASGGTQITFSTAPASGASIFIVEISGAVGGTVTPSDNSVGITQLNVSDGSNGQALTTNGSGTLSFASVGLAGIDDQSSSNDDQVTITDTAVVINEDSDDLDFRVETNGNANMLFVSGGNDVVGIGAEGDLGSGLHIKTADSSGSVSADADELVLESNGNTGITMLGGTGNACRIHFGDSGDNDIGFINYAHDDNNMLFGANASTRMTIRSSGDVGIGTSGSDGTRLKVEKDATGKTCQFRNIHSSTPRGIEVQYGGAAPDDTSNDTMAINFEDNSTSRIKIFADGDIQNHDGTYGTLSDSRIKDNITDASSQWDDIKAIKVRKYKKKDDVRDYADKAPTHIGVIAQELEASGMNGLVKEVDPSKGEIKSDSTFGTLYQDGDTLPEGKEIGDIKEIKSQVKSVKYSILYMKAIKALQEAMTRIETLEAKVKTLEEG
jgi:hypothetical protein